MIAKAGLAYCLNELLNDRPLSIKEGFKQGIACKQEIKKYSFLYTVLLIIGETGIKRYLHRRVQQLGGSDFISSAKEDDWFELTFVMIPLFVLDKMSIQHAIKKSCSLMQTTFGNPINSFFSFVACIVTFGFFIASPLAHIISKNTNGLIGISLFFLLLGVVMCGIRAIEAIFQLIVYRFCLQKSIGVFSKNDIMASFIKEDYSG